MSEIQETNQALLSFVVQRTLIDLGNKAILPHILLNFYTPIFIPTTHSLHIKSWIPQQSIFHTPDTVITETLLIRQSKSTWYPAYLPRLHCQVFKYVLFQLHRCFCSHATWQVKALQRNILHTLFIKYILMKELIDPVHMKLNKVRTTTTSGCDNK